MKNAILTESAPAPIGPYSQAVTANGFLFISGQIALDPVSGKMTTSGIEEETQRVMQHLSAVLNAAGSGWNKVVKVTIFIIDMNNFASINNIYSSYVVAPFPARETVEVSRLPKDANIEISLIATT